MAIRPSAYRLAVPAEDPKARLLLAFGGHGAISQSAWRCPGVLNIILKLDTSTQRLQDIVRELKGLGCEILAQP